MLINILAYYANPIEGCLIFQATFFSEHKESFSQFLHHRTTIGINRFEMSQK
jgi:hypothetical protein